jgi:FAD/FMN-containing dehydrogenase
MRQVHGHGHGGDGVLRAVLAVSDDQGELNAADADAVDGQAAVVVLGLGVGEIHEKRVGKKNPTVTGRQQWGKNDIRETAPW